VPNRRLSASNGFESIYSGRWDSNPRRPAWEAAGVEFQPIDNTVTYDMLHEYLSFSLSENPDFADILTLIRCWPTLSQQTKQYIMDLCWEECDG